jgi:hydrogenase maturation factor
MSGSTQSNGTEASARLILADGEAIEARLPDKWRYTRLVSANGEYGKVRRESVSRDYEDTLIAASQHDGQWCVGEFGHDDRAMECVDESSAVAVLIELAKLREAERVVETAPEYKPEFVDEAENGRTEMLLILGEARRQLPREGR